MKPFSVLLVLTVTTFPLLVSSLETAGEDSNAFVRQAIPEKGKCRVNICFAFEGSGSLTGAEFFSQKRFINKVVRAISKRNDLNVSGVEYGLENKVITTITPNVKEFLSLLRKVPFTREPTNFVSGGLLFCQGQLRKNEDDPDRIVLLGSGRADFGGDPVPRVQGFLKSGGKIFALGVGEVDRKELIAIVGGDPSKVFKLGARAEDDKILAPFLSKLCGHPVIGASEGLQSTEDPLKFS